MSRTFHVVVPARYAATRLPGKPLADLGGVPMIVRVARQARASRAASVVVATDDRRVLDVLAAHRVEGVITRPDHASGSDRVMEVAAKNGWADDAIVVNVQGDEPLIPPAVIEQVADLLEAEPAVGMATLCEPIRARRDVFDPNIVKVVRSAAGRALYFSRAPIPWARASFATSRTDEPLPAEPVWWRHIGIYGFRIATLRRFCAWPTGTLERAESLEQLRLLEHGVAVAVAIAIEPVPGGVDTPEDLERLRALLGSKA